VIATYVSCYNFFQISIRNLNSSFSMFLTDETEDEDVNKEYIEETNRDAVMIAAAKLVASDAVPKVSIVLFVCF
jgi:hypothetical protein